MLGDADFGYRYHAHAPSPVRGQLEPQEIGVKQGWRYINCTETPNELKVLLPPRTSLFYGKLLKAEVAALSKPDAVDWARLVEIRHLKDRMLRKCIRLSKAWTASRTGRSRPMFLALTAPENFRVKEMERWMQKEEARVKTPLKKPSIHIDEAKKGSVCCERCARAQPHSVPAKATRRPVHSSRPMSPFRGPSRSSLRMAPSTSTMRSTHRRGPLWSPTKGELHEIISHESLDDLYANEHPPHETHAQHAHSRDDRSVHSVDDRHASASPDPLPIPYRHRDSVDLRRISVANSATRSRNSLSGSASPPSDSHRHDRSATPAPGEAGPQPPLVRRRSSLKQPNASIRMSYSGKNVAWATDKDLVEQVAKRDIAVKEVDIADHEWEEVRAKYVTQLSGLRALRDTVSRSLERLRREAEKLQREEAAMREEEGRLRVTFENLERKQDQYRAKVKAALDESHNVVTLCTTKRNADIEAL